MGDVAPVDSRIRGVVDDTGTGGIPEETPTMPFALALWSPLFELRDDAEHIVTRVEEEMSLGDITAVFSKLFAALEAENVSTKSAERQCITIKVSASRCETGCVTLIRMHHRHRDMTVADRRRRTVAGMVGFVHPPIGAGRGNCLSLPSLCDLSLVSRNSYRRTCVVQTYPEGKVFRTQGPSDSHRT
jgi:hypothetical protein